MDEITANKIVTNTSPPKAPLSAFSIIEICADGGWFEAYAKDDGSCGFVRHYNVKEKKGEENVHNKRLRKITRRI